MNYKKIFSEKNEYLIVLAMLFAVPLFFDLQTFNAFILPKQIIFDFLFWLLIIIWSGRLYVEQQFHWPKSGRLNLLVALFVSAEILSLIFSPAASQAWFGSNLRLYGSFLTLQLLVVFLWWIMNYGYIKGRLILFINTVTLSGVLVSIYGLLQAFGFDPLKWQVYANTLIRSSSTIGQPNYLASFLLGVLAVSALGFYRAKRVKSRAAYLLSLSIEFTALIFTLSRGAWLGLVGAALILALIYLHDKKRKQFWLSGALIGVIFGAWLFIGLNGYASASQAVGQSEFKKRMASVFDFHQVSIRGYYYEAALDLIKKRPFFGYGRDSLGYFFYPYYAPDWSVYEVINQSTDRAHNFFLDLWLQVGILGVIFWLGLFYYIVQSVAGLLWVKPIIVISLAGVLAIFISWQFGFETLEPALLFWILLGLIIGELGLETREVELPVIGSILVGSFFFFFCLLGFLSDLNRYQVSKLYRHLLMSGDLTENIHDVKSILSRATVSDLKSFYGPHLYGLIDDKIKFSRLSKRETQDIVGSLEDLNTEPKSFDYRLNRLVFSVNMSKELFWQGGGRNLAASLERDYTDLKQDAQKYAVLELGWGNLLFYQKKFGEALRHYKKALALYPDLSNPRINVEHKGYIEFERNQALERIPTCEQELKSEILSSREKGVEIKDKKIQ